MFFRPICLPSPTALKGAMLGMTGFATGWGVTDLDSPKAQAQVLQQVRISCPIAIAQNTDTHSLTENMATLTTGQVAVEMMERETCRQKYGKVNPVTDNMMCARAEGAGTMTGHILTDL